MNFHIGCYLKTNILICIHNFIVVCRVLMVKCAAGQVEEKSNMASKWNDSFENSVARSPIQEGWGMSSKFFSFWKFKPSLSQFLQMRLNHLLLRFFPFTISRFYIRVLGRIYYLLHWQERSLVRETVSRIFRSKIAAGELQRKIQGVFRGIFDHYHEKLFVGFFQFP